MAAWIAAPSQIGYAYCILFLAFRRRVMRASRYAILRPMSRQGIIADLAGHLAALQRPHPVRVAIDGVDAAGKTKLADALAAALEGQQRAVIRASIDGFHRPRAERYQRGADSPLGYYADSFNYPALRESLLLPL